MKYTIYQPKEVTFHSFMVDDDKKDYLKADFVNKYDSEIEKLTEDETTGSTLERLFEIFNIRRPHDFHGHSLSTGDIVVLDGQAWICASFGWNKINLN